MGRGSEGTRDMYRIQKTMGQSWSAHSDHEAPYKALGGPHPIPHWTLRWSGAARCRRQ
jgi:hypothetical protein